MLICWSFGQPSSPKSPFLHVRVHVLVPPPQVALHTVKISQSTTSTKCQIFEVNFNDESFNYSYTCQIPLVNIKTNYVKRICYIGSIPVVYRK